MLHFQQNICKNCLLILIASSPKQRKNVEKDLENIHSIHKHIVNLSTAICRVQLVILLGNIILNRLLQTQTSSNSIENYISLLSSHYPSKK